MEQTTQAKPAVKIESAGRHDTRGQMQVNAVKAMLPFISTDETRQALKYIHVTEDGEFLEATDGHKAIRLPRLDVSPDLFPATSYRVVKDGKGFLLVPEDAPQFPNMAQVIPGPAHKAKWYFEMFVAPKDSIQGPLLCAFGKAGLALNAAVVASIPEGQWAFWGTGELSPVRADRVDGTGWTAVLMPMRESMPKDFTPPKAPDPVEDGALASPEVVASVIAAAPVPAYIQAMRAAGGKP